MTSAPTDRRLRPGSLEVLLVSLIALAVFASAMSAFVAERPGLSVAATVFCGVFVQALPFLVLGVVLSGLIAAFVSAERLSRWLPRRPALAVAVAGVGGAALPGCECGSVPVARRLFGPGTSGAAALTFMLSAPAINPVVLVATAVAFPGQPAMVAGPLRGVAGHRRHDGPPVVPFRADRMGHPSSARATRGRGVALDGVQRGRPPRLSAGVGLPGARRCGRRSAARARPSVDVLSARRSPAPRGADHGTARRRAGVVFGG